MNFRSSIIGILLLVALFFGAYTPVDQNPQKENLILSTVLTILEQAHFSPVPLDDSFSEEVFNDYLSQIDYGKRFLTQEDIEKMKGYSSNLDDEARANSLEFFELSIQLLDEGIKKANKFYSEVIKVPVDLYSQEYIELDHEKKSFAKNDEDLKNTWAKSLHYEIMVRVDRKIDELKDESYKLEDLEKEAREKVKTLYDDLFVRMDQLRRSDRFEAYVNSFTHLFDPHTDYFTPKGKQDFDISMGGKFEGIGARLSQDGDFTKIVSIIPGGPAWKGKELEVDDLVTGVRQENEEEAVDVMGMRTDDVVQLIRGKKGTIVYLSVKKKDGGYAEIKIQREVVIVDESFARSVILDIPGVMENVGYIKLPKFYSSFEGKDGNSSAVDVAKEIEKLKENDVNGIILDLRNNGGGSLKDVVDMSGLFIEDGPIVQVKPRYRNAYVYEDEDEKVHWDGPLIVMVNSYSASASEILAAALQDYKRAVIVGSNSTYGKGTVQRFYDLDRAVRGAKDLKPLGQIKLTMQKYYRITGGSVQLKGVQPDIVIPDRFSFVDIGEKEYDHAMEWTELEGVNFNQDVFVVNNLSELRNNSSARLKGKEDFSLIRENAERLKKNRDLTKYPLNLETYKRLIDQKEVEAKKFEKLFSKEIESLKVKNMDVDLVIINMDESKKARNEDWIKGIKKDIYLEEALFILKDLVSEL